MRALDSAETTVRTLLHTRRLRRNDGCHLRDDDSACDGQKPKKYEADFLVDTGATDCLAPANKLRKAGVKPMGKMSYELANGSVVEYPFSVMVIEFMREITGGRVIFGPDDDEPFLGVTALESVGIIIDPASQTLKRQPAVPLK